MFSFDLLISLIIITIMFSYTFYIAFAIINRIAEYPFFLKTTIAFQNSERIVMKNMQKPYHVELSDLKGRCVKLVCDGKVVIENPCEYFVKRFVIFNERVCELYVGTKL